MSEFNRLLLNLHADARLCDRDQALLGALGVGAFAYPHQLDSVHRMLTAPACRWLLADEVGLGKTVQAIMVMRALAAQSPRPFVAALVVPDDLIEQWERELLARGHVLAIEADTEAGPSGNLILRLSRPSRIAAGGKVYADVDLLLIDEFTKLQVAVREELISTARAIPHVVAMTATPALHLARTRAELMELIEPDAARVARAQGRSILQVLGEREETALRRFGGELGDAARRRTVEDGFGLYRRLIRTQRADYPDTLPQRRYQPIRVAPTDGDVERARAARRYLEVAQAAALGLKRDALLQVAGRSPRSLRDRLSTLRRAPSTDAAWRDIDAVLRGQPGDAKLDALVDHVRGVLAREPRARLVVVAEDNPTTDYLAEALERLVDAKIARKRRSMRAAEELEAQVTMLRDAIEDFVSGDANILIAAVDAREGHNLQFADEIVFFALPWSPHDIQQWIGRIDRLGTRGLPGSRTIAITPIVTHGSIEARILDVLEKTKVFEKSEVYDEAEWEAISDAINAAAAGEAGASWKEAATRAQNLGDGADEWLQSTKLPPSSRRLNAERRVARLRGRPYACPLQPRNDKPWDWFQGRERGLNILLRLAREEYFDIRDDMDGDQAFRTIWYKSSSEPELPLPDIDGRHAGHRLAFIAERAEIGCPPNVAVEQPQGSKRRLHFLDHGCGLHDQLVAGLSRKAIPTEFATEFEVEYPPGHPILAWADRRLLVASAILELAATPMPDLEAIVGPADPQASKPEQEARAGALRDLKSALVADRRWLLDLAPPEFLIEVLVEDDGQFAPLAEVAAAFLDPSHGGQRGRQLGLRRSPLPSATLDRARGAVQDALARRKSEALSRLSVAVEGAAQLRLLLVDADIEQQVAAPHAERASAEALDQKLVFNQAAVRGAALAERLAQAAGNARRAWLAGARDAVAHGALLSKRRSFWVVPRVAGESRAGRR